MVAYQYTKLSEEDGEIRLITLMPGQWDDEISIEIFHTPLVLPNRESKCKRLSVEELQNIVPKNMIVSETVDGRYLFVTDSDFSATSWNHPDPGFDHVLYELRPQENFPEHEPKWEALSYVWGSTANLLAVHVMGQVPTTFGIGSNLITAFKHLRYSDKSRTMWVDAICINQNDIAERNREVKRMRNIYSLASRTIIWLGEEADDSTRALSTLEHFAKHVEFTGGGMIAQAPSSSRAWWCLDYQLPYDESTWSCLAALFLRPWFSRVWVLQEALLGNQLSTVQCGKNFISWTMLRKAMLVLGRNTTIPQEMRHLLLSYRPGLFPHSMRGFPELLRWAKHRQCIDPRDKIYGILGLVAPAIADAIELDYSMPTSQIYMSALLSYISVTKQLDLLGQCRLDQRFQNAPSWIPNWSFKDKSTMIGIELGRCPSGRSFAQARYLPPHILEIIGVCCGRISSVGTRVSGNAGEIFQVIRQWEPEGFQTKNYISGGSLFDAFLETIFQGQVKERYPLFFFPTLKNIRNAYLDAISGDIPFEEVMASNMYWPSETVTFIATVEGHLGVTSHGVKKDDFVCVFLGSNLPIILRPTTSGNFLVVGSCFIHGLMDGEAFLGALPSPWKTELLRTNNSGKFLTYFVQPSKVKTLNDPRLPPLPFGWEEVNIDDNGYHATTVGQFRNITTGEVTEFDPRMHPDILKQNGVKLERFRLI